MKKLLLSHKLLLLFITIFYVQSSHAQTTYTVTSTTVGPSSTFGTFLWAVDQANTNTGADIIQFTAGLQIDASVNPTGFSPFMAEITESVTINGNGGALNGNQFWVSQGGIINSLTDCPGNVSGTVQSSFMPGFIKVGTPGANNSAIEVTVKNLTINKFNSIATVSDNATLKFDNFEATETWSTYQCVSEPAILARAGASLEIYNSTIQDAVMWGISGGSAAIFSAPNAGDLTIEESVLLNNNLDEQPLINWNGASGSKVNVVSSRLIRSGGIISDGASVSNIVNSTWVTNKFLVPGLGDRFENISSQPMNITASSFVWNTWECDGLCQNFLAFNNLFEIKGAGNINFSETAVGFNLPASGGATALLNTLGINGGTGVFTADAYTWIQPTTKQDVAALETITSQPALLTTTPAFNSPVSPLGTLYDLELAAPAVPGELIAVIPAGISLTNPITNSPITLDVAGNPRVDSNGKRDIGALQTDVSLGVDDLDLLNGKFSYYPNPVEDYLHINLEENFSAKLFSINGALLMDAKNKNTIDITNFTSGIYILQIQVEDKIYSSKILKK